MLLGVLSSRYVWLSRGEPEPTQKALKDRQVATLFRPDLDEEMARHSFFADLIAHAHRHPRSRLARWWSPTLTRAAVQGRGWSREHGPHPEAHGVWTEDGREIRFFLEHVAGAMAISDLMERIGRHWDFHDSGGLDLPGAGLASHPRT